MKLWISSLVESFRLYYGEPYYHTVPWVFRERTTPYKMWFVEFLRFRFVFTVPHKQPYLNWKGDVRSTYSNLIPKA
jgi:hypothetical protein